MVTKVNLSVHTPSAPHLALVHDSAIRVEMLDAPIRVHSRRHAWRVQAEPFDATQQYVQVVMEIMV